MDEENNTESLQTDEAHTVEGLEIKKETPKEIIDRILSSPPITASSLEFWESGDDSKAGYPTVFTYFIDSNRFELPPKAILGKFIKHLARDYAFSSVLNVENETLTVMAKAIQLFVKFCIFEMIVEKKKRRLTPPLTNAKMFPYMKTLVEEKFLFLKLFSKKGDLPVITNVMTVVDVKKGKSSAKKQPKKHEADPITTTEKRSKRHRRLNTTFTDFITEETEN